MPMMTARDRQAYRADDQKDHTLLSEQERQRMLKVCAALALLCLAVVLTRPSRISQHQTIPRLPSLQVREPSADLG